MERYTDTEFAMLREQLRKGNAMALAVAKARGYKRDPRLANLT